MGCTVTTTKNTWGQHVQELLCRALHANIVSGETCSEAEWKLLRGQTSLGGKLYVGPRTIQQCLKHCDATANCVAVDIDVNLVPLRCWTHVSASDLRLSNLYVQVGTYHYRLVRRCTNATAGTLRINQ